MKFDLKSAVDRTSRYFSGQLLVFLSGLPVVAPCDARGPAL